MSRIMAATPKTVFITGGASGIGYAFTEIFLRKACKVAIFDLRIAEEIRQTLSSLAASTDSAVAFYEVDVRDAKRLVKTAKEAAEQLGAPEFVLNSAGIAISKTFMKLEQNEFEQVIDINLKGSRNVAAATLPLMQPGSHIAFIASLAGVAPNYSYAAYSASKFGVVGLAGVLRIELKERGIDVSVICPPEIMTPMVEKELKTIHPITRELKLFAGTLELNSACQYILKELTKRKFMIIPGFKARILWLLTRFFPGFLHRTMDNVVAKHKS